MSGEVNTSEILNTTGRVFPSMTKGTLAALTVLVFVVAMYYGVSKKVIVVNKPTPAPPKKQAQADSSGMSLPLGAENPTTSSVPDNFTGDQIGNDVPENEVDPTLDWDEITKKANLGTKAILDNQDYSANIVAKYISPSAHFAMDHDNNSNWYGLFRPNYNVPIPNKHSKVVHSEIPGEFFESNRKLLSYYKTS